MLIQVHILLQREQVQGLVLISITACSLKASNSEKEFDNSIDLFGTTSASYTFKVKDAGNGEAAIDAKNGLKLEDMPMGVGVYETTIEVTITDLNGIKTVVNIPIKVQ